MTYTSIMRYTYRKSKENLLTTQEFNKKVRNSLLNRS